MADFGFKEILAEFILGYLEFRTFCVLFIFLSIRSRSSMTSVKMMGPSF